MKKTVCGASATKTSRKAVVFRKPWAQDQARMREKTTAHISVSTAMGTSTLWPGS